MLQFTTLRKQVSYAAMCVAILLLTSVQAFAQTAPNLRTVATYGAFSGEGAIQSTGLTVIKGDIGTNMGAFTGFPPGIYTGAKHVADAASLAAKNDLILAYNSMNDATNAVIYDTILNATMGNGQVLTPRTYRRGDLTTISGNLTFDAQGNSNAIFIIKIGAALNAAENTQIILANGARAANIYWAVGGAVSILENSVFKGSILADGAIHLYVGTTLEGRALSVIGAVTFASNTVTVPGTAVVPINTLVVITPATGDTVRSGMQNYQIKWAGTGIAPVKTFEYSLDSGMTWNLIGGTSTTGYTYNWNVPDTVSRKALVRITDANNLRGVSGLFTIARAVAPNSLVVVRPALGDTIAGGTQNYQITWTGTGLTQQKTFELSLDSGLTWTMIGTVTNDSMTYAWNVPDTNSSRAIVRITDQNGVTGRSGVFSIVKSAPVPGSIVIKHPVAGEIITGGYQNFLIAFTATNTTLQKTFEYSLDGGVTWTMIGTASSDDQFYTWPSVPNVATTQALVRITDANGITGTSGLFTITMVPQEGSIDGLFLTGLDANNNIGNNQLLGISWTYTPDIGTSVNVEYSLDYTATWVHIATVLVSESPNTTWMTPMTGYYNPVFVRVTSTKGMTRASSPFSIGNTISSVSNDAATNGYSVSTYPNPANNQTTISFVLPVQSNVALTIVDGNGRTVSTVLTQHFDAGTYTVPVSTSTLASGMYTYVLQAGNTRTVGQMSVVK